MDFSSSCSSWFEATEKEIYRGVKTKTHKNQKNKWLIRILELIYQKTKTWAPKSKSDSVTIAQKPQLFSTAEQTQPSSAYSATVRCTLPTSSSPSTLAHLSVIPVTLPLLPFSAPQSALFCARTVTGNVTETHFHRYTIGGHSRGSLGVPLWMNCWVLLGLKRWVRKLCFWKMRVVMVLMGFRIFWFGMLLVLLVLMIWLVQRIRLMIFRLWEFLLCLRWII